MLCVPALTNLLMAGIHKLIETPLNKSFLGIQVVKGQDKSQKPRPLDNSKAIG